MKKYYKIVEKKGNNYLTLFHGINGTRVLPINEWITAEIKANVADGKGKTYTSGLHVIEGYDNAVEYLKRFKRTDRVIVECEVLDIWHKEKSKPYVYLAKKIKIVLVDSI